MRVLAPVFLASAFLATQAVTFRDVTEKAGLNAIIVSGGEKKNYVLEVNGSGVCWLDYNDDGWMDLYLVNGSTLTQLQKRSSAAAQRNHLYRNNGDGTFTDQTAAAGVPGRGWGFGCAAADYDNDGHTDLLITNLGPNVLYRNLGNGKFVDVTAKAGVAGGDYWHSGAAFGDYDRDGHLDLFVPGYLRFDSAAPEFKMCEYRGIQVHACGPMGYQGDPDFLYRNNGDGTFTDVTGTAGVTDRKLYFGFQAVFEDFDNDGWPDLLVANDSNPNYLYRNKRDGSFEEVGVQSGIALSGDGKELSSMGVAVGDYDGDGHFDVFITTFANDNYVLFHNDGDGFFTDVSYPSGVGEATVPYLGWGTFFFDYDNDGLPDIFCANGHVYPEVTGKLRETFRQPLQLFRNMGQGKFRDASAAAGFAAMAPLSARGASFADYNNDGYPDVVVSVMDGKPVLLENAGGGGNWLRIRLSGVASNKMGVGARVKVTAGGKAQFGSVHAGGSYLSSNDPRLHFGLGPATEADIVVTWPSGAVQTVQKVKANQQLEITEPARTSSPENP